MSTNQVTVSTNNQQTTNYDLSKIFLLNNRYQSGNYTNSGYVAVTLPAGTVIGRIAATGAVVPLKSTASDGSQFPIGILAQDYTIQPGAVTSLMYGVCGDVAQELIVFNNGTDTLSTIVSGRQLFDRIQFDTVGIFIKPSVDLTDYDN
jgi:hypothetical protein